METNKMSVEKLIVALESDNMVEAKECFESALSEKISAKFEARKVELAKEMSQKKENLDKDSDDPCWPGYVKLGTKMKDGKEVPNCVPMEEALNQTFGSYIAEAYKKGDSVAVKNARKYDSAAKQTVSGKVIGMSGSKVMVQVGSGQMNVDPKDIVTESLIDESRDPDDMFAADAMGGPGRGTVEKGYNRHTKETLWTAKNRSGSMKVFDNERAAKRYAKTESIDHSVNEKVDKSNPIYKEYEKLKKLDIKALRDMIKGQHRGVVDVSGYTSKDQAATEILRLKHGDRRVDAAFGLKESTDLTESTVSVSVRDARLANEIARDMFRGEYKNDGTTNFVFKKNDAAEDFRAELSKRNVEVD
jgi:hypothetical protein